jgi:hypothetical protein
LEVGAEGGFKLNLRQDCDPGRQDHDPGKQKLNGAVRTETYWRHYCQQHWSQIIYTWRGVLSLVINDGLNLAGGWQKFMIPFFLCPCHKYFHGSFIFDYLKYDARIFLNKVHIDISAETTMPSLI